MKLSICIPTHNFGKFIGETLDSIIPQLNDETEIVVLDGASKDNTQEVVEAYMKRCPQIRYFRQSEKGGIDKDMHLSVEKARGEYCWLFSSDDVMKQGVLAQVFEEMKLGLDVYLCGFTICNLEMTAVLQEFKFSTLDHATVVNLSDENERAQYFAAATTTTAFFSFMSSLIIKRKRWMETSEEPSFFGSCWAHAARIFRMIPKGLRIKYMPTPFLLKRSFNDSFMDQGFLHRISIGVDGYQNIADAIFGHGSLEAFHIRRVLRNEFFIDAFLMGRDAIKGYRDIFKLFRLIARAYSDVFLKRWMLFILIFTMPKRTIGLLRYAYAFQKNLRRRCSKEVFKLKQKWAA